MKICAKCNQMLDNSQFNLSNPRTPKTSKLQSYCRGCSKQYAKGWYQVNRETHKAKTLIQLNARTGPIRDWYRAEKESTPCTDCRGYHEWYNMEYDHISDDKDHNIGSMITAGFTREEIQAEMNKCELVCVMCHRNRTYSRAGNNTRYSDIPRTPRSSAEEHMVSTHLVGSSNLSEGTQGDENE
jgi:hypothetical protein